MSNCLPPFKKGVNFKLIIKIGHIEIKTFVTRRWIYVCMLHDIDEDESDLSLLLSRL